MKFNFLILFSLFSVNIFGNLSFEADACKNEYETYGLSTQEAYNYINTHLDKITIIDVRESFKYKSGHIINAINIDFLTDNFNYQIYKLDRNEIYFIYSDSEDDSFTTTLMMIEMGFISPYFLKDGLKSWRKRGYPLYKTP